MFIYLLKLYYLCRLRYRYIEKYAIINSKRVVTENSKKIAQQPAAVAAKMREK